MISFDKLREYADAERAARNVLVEARQKADSAIQDLRRIRSAKADVQQRTPNEASEAEARALMRREAEAARAWRRAELAAAAAASRWSRVATLSGWARGYAAELRARGNQGDAA